MNKIKILFSNVDQAGVYLHQTQTPALGIEKNNSNEFDVTINRNVDWRDYEYLKQFQIITSHRQFCPYEMNDEFFTFCKKNNIVTVLMIDDHPSLSKDHSLYQQLKIDKMDVKTYDTLSRADAFTTTTEYFKNVLTKYNPVGMDLENSVDVDLLPQFRYKRKPSDKLRFSWIGGSSHKADLELFRDACQVLSNSTDLHSKMTLGLHGYDLRGSVNEVAINPELLKELGARGINIQQVFNEFNNVGGNIDDIKSIPFDLKLKYKLDFTQNNQRPIRPEESVWSDYEKIFTDNYKLIKDPNYLAHLKKFVNESYEGEENQVYRRFFTKNVNSYATHYDECDVSLVLLQNNNEFNRCKSALKICEAQAKHCAIITSDHPIYTKYIKHGVNGLVAKDSRDYLKLMKRYISNPQMVIDHQNQLREDVKDVFDLDKITEKRVNFYKELLKKKGLI